MPEQSPKTAAECRRLIGELGCACQTYLDLLKEHLRILQQRELQEQ